MPTGQVTRTTAANNLSQLWSREMELAANEEAVVRPYVTALGKLEKQLNIPKVAAITPQTSIAAGNFGGQTGTALVFWTNTEDAVTVTPTTTHAAIEMARDAEWQTKYDLRSPYRQQGVAAIVQQIDTDIAGLASSASNNVGSAASDMDEALLLSGKRVLITNAKEHYKPGITPACLLIHPVQSDHLQSISNIMQAYARGDNENPLVGGWVRVGLGFTIKESGVVKQSAGTTSNWLFVKTAVGVGFNTSPEIMVVINEIDLVVQIIPVAQYGFAEIWDGDHVEIRTTTTA